MRTAGRQFYDSCRVLSFFCIAVLCVAVCVACFALQFFCCVAALFDCLFVLQFFVLQFFALQFCCVANSFALQFFLCFCAMQCLQCSFVLFCLRYIVLCCNYFYAAVFCVAFLRCNSFCAAVCLRCSLFLFGVAVFFSVCIFLALQFFALL